MAVVWPGALPEAPLRSGLRIAAQDNLVRSQTGTGPGKTRRRATRAPINVACSIYVDDAQRAAFTAFFRGALLDGAIRFTWPGLDAAVDGAPHEYQFMEPPAHSPLGVGWQIDMVLQAW